MPKAAQNKIDPSDMEIDPADAVIIMIIMFLMSAGILFVYAKLDQPKTKFRVVDKTWETTKTLRVGNFEEREGSKVKIGESAEEGLWVDWITIASVTSAGNYLKSVPDLQFDEDSQEQSQKFDVHRIHNFTKYYLVIDSEGTISQVEVDKPVWDQIETDSFVYVENNLLSNASITVISSNVLEKQ